MNGHTATRYTASALDVVAGVSLLVIAVIHLLTGVVTAVLPLAAAGVLLWAATVLAPVGPNRVVTANRPPAVLFVETLGFAIVAMALFVFLGTIG